MKAPRLTQREIARSCVGLTFACAAFLGGVAFGQSRPSVGPQNLALGQASAPVTLLEYGSLTCGHCGEFNNDVMPTIKRIYIDTGRVRYVFRPLPTPPFDLSVAMHALTLCAAPNRYYPLVDAFFERQQEVFNAAQGETGPKGTIFALAQDVGGLSYSASEACLRDPARQEQIMASANAGAAAGVTSTPTLFVNGVLVTIPAGKHHHEVASVAQAIDTALAASAQRRQQAAKLKAKSKAKKR